MIPVLALVLGSVACGAGAPKKKQPRALDIIRLVHEGTACARIVIPASPKPVEVHAATELNSFLSRMSGAKLPVVNKPAADETNVFIGSAAPKDTELTEQLLGLDGFVVKTRGKDLILAGVKPYSCLYAVYHLLDTHLGCGFFQDGDQVPHRKTIEVRKLNDVEKPRFEWRILGLFHTPAYSGMRWNDWEEWKQYFDWAIKKRYNMCETNWLSEYTGVAALAAGKLGVKIELTPWQKQNTALLRRVFDRARMCGMRFVYSTNFYRPWLTSEPGSMPYYDAVQTQEFVRGYQKLTGRKIPQVPYRWFAATFQWMDPSHPETQRFLKACVEACGEALGNDDHCYAIEMPAEGGFGGGLSQEERNKLVYSTVLDIVKTIKAADPKAFIYTRPPFPHGKTYEAQKRAVRDAGIPIVAEFWLHLGRFPGWPESSKIASKTGLFLWGLPCSTGMIVGCGKFTNPYGDMNKAIQYAKQLAADPRAKNCKGFFCAGEYNHRRYIMLDLYCALAWNQASVDRDEFLRLWTQRRYGPETAARMLPAIRAIADSLLFDPHVERHRGVFNIPLYRGGYGDLPSTVKQTMSYLPKMRQALERMVSEHDRLEGSSMYRFDLVDYGRTYLGAIFSDRLARARKAVRAGDKAAFEKAAAGVEEVMHFIARYVSAHRLFRLKTHDDRAKRFPQILPGHDNAQSNWVTFTVTQSLTCQLLDYEAEDYAELVEHYFWPRVKLYLESMRKLVNAGKDISVPPNKWSPYGLMHLDRGLAQRIIKSGSVSGKFDFYQGPMEPLVRELLKRFPVPKDLAKILAEPDYGVPANTEFVASKPGATVYGFSAVVEKTLVPKELGSLVKVQQVSKDYDVMRGPTVNYRVESTDFVKLTRRKNEKSERGGHAVAVFDFDFGGKRWVMRYDSGSKRTAASLSIVAAKTR